MVCAGNAVGYDKLIRTGKLTVFLVTGLLLASCQNYLPGVPVPQSMSPDHCTLGEETPVVIQGHNFCPSIRISYQDESHSGIQVVFEAHLG